MSIWLLPVLGKILFAYGLFPIILKANVGLPSRTKRFALQFLFCMILAVITANIISPLTINRATAVIFVLGLMNGIAAYAQWKAIDISLSKNALFTFWDDIIAMGLSYFILNEGKCLTSETYAGITLSLGSVILFSLHSYRRNKQDKQATPPRFFLYVGFYSLVWGIATFLMRYFGVAGVSAASFLVPWYLGAFIASLVLLSLTASSQNRTTVKVVLSVRDISWMFALALCVFISLALGYTAYQLAPQNIVQPFFLVGEMILPALIGLFIFSERRGFDKTEKFSFALGALGGIIIAISKI
jgi:hypothetical protein